MKEEVKGPYSKDQIVSMYNNGSIYADTQYCRESSEHWQDVVSLIPPSTPMTIPIPSSTEVSEPVQKSGSGAGAFVIFVLLILGIGGGFYYANNQGYINLPITDAHDTKSAEYNAKYRSALEEWQRSVEVFRNALGQSDFSVTTMAKNTNQNKINNLVSICREYKNYLESRSSLDVEDREKLSELKEVLRMVEQSGQ